jgi:hypothetical protein
LATQKTASLLFLRAAGRTDCLKHNLTHNEEAFHLQSPPYLFRLIEPHRCPAAFCGRSTPPAGVSAKVFVLNSQLRYESLTRARWSASPRPSCVASGEAVVSNSGASTVAAESFRVAGSGIVWSCTARFSLSSAFFMLRYIAQMLKQRYRNSLLLVSRIFPERGVALTRRQQEPPAMLLQRTTSLLWSLPSQKP